MATATVPSCRVRQLNEAPERPDGDYVLLWTVAYRRLAYNFSLDYAVELCRRLRRPLLMFEPLRVGYPWASVRLHTFVLQGMADNAADAARAKVTYYPYVEPEHDAGKGLLAALAERACAVVTDDFPAYFVPRMLARAAEVLDVSLTAIDSHGLLPQRVLDKAYPSAASFRRAVHKVMPEHLPQAPRPSLRAEAVLQGAPLPAKITKRWPVATAAQLEARPEALAKLPIDQEVGPSVVPGGRREGVRRLTAFVDDVLSRYADDRNHPDRGGQSGMSPYLHFGHVSSHEIFAQIAERDDWSMDRLDATAIGKREGFWGMSAEAESFLDEAVVWRELGANMCVQRPDDYMAYGSLPDWAKKTLAEHQEDPREHVYTVGQLARSETDDPIWNAAQNELRRTGRLHNYMRMLWGKRILAWTRTPQDALAALIELNDRYAIDGRDPNSYAGIFWTLGRYDRPWPTHNVFGKVRMMSSASTKRKLQLKRYLETYGTDAAQGKKEAARAREVCERVREQERHDPKPDAKPKHTVSARQDAFAAEGASKSKR